MILWTSDGDGSFSDPSTLNTVYTPTQEELNAGITNITLKITTAGCSGSATDQMKITWTDGINDTDKAFGFNLYPNPTNGVFTISLDNLESNETVTYIIHTATGREVFREIAEVNGNSYERQIDMSKFIAGMYFVTVQSEKGNKTMKFIKQ